ncbi:acylneuraminate cytidylyltransferase [Kribbella flavida DSM 17836]|uniref:Acylneuraminate cytidylyltransferase n=1 Tax=Kribbella flavida (strain DSM 17836 / JCM 10339 / NBRC 14399) TaxID=479435 RepID=D2PVV1_KRIFD|nr:glycosyltransferase family protein [Kribbella flavida]ADB29608.1 acylneuraminate cytidylyltransferase [Kribbella flavida DSM 17836]
MKIGIITQARATSTRLPAKVLLTAGGKTFLQHHLDRLAATGLPVIVATTTNTDDEPIVEQSGAAGFPVWRGSELDVLSRFAGAIREHGLDGVVRVTSDCPLIDPAVVTEGVDRFRADAAENLYVSNCLERTYPRGMDYEIFSADRLLRADAEATLPADREHVTSYLHQNRTGDMRLLNLPWDGGDASQYRLTLDTQDDRRLLTTLIEDFGAAQLNCADLVAIMGKHPELHALNEHVEQKKLGQ